MGIHYDYKSTKSAKLMEKQAKRERKLAEKKAKRLAKEGPKKDDNKAFFSNYCLNFLINMIYILPRKFYGHTLRL